MNHKRLIIFLIFSILLVCFMGCDEPDKQADAPETYYEDISVVTKVTPTEYERMAGDEINDFLSDYKSVNNGNTLTIFVNNESDKPAGFRIEYSDNSVYINGSSSDLTYLAAQRFIYDFLENKPENLTVEKISTCNISYEMPAYEEYVNDIDLFLPVWMYQYQAPEYMRDFSEKQASFNASGRMMISAHRGGIEFYPENSAEAIISSIKMGVDIVEIDVVFTKDFVLVLGHGELSEFTDWEEKKGKNGLPSSNKVSDWTYEQLQELNLKFNYGEYSSAGGETTPYKIPALKDILLICKDRIFVNIDKLDTVTYWKMLYNLLKETGTTQNYLFGKTFVEYKRDLSKYEQNMIDDGFPVSKNYYCRKHCGDLAADLLLNSEKEFTEFFNKYNKPGNNFLTDNPYIFVQYLAKTIQGE